MSNFIKSSNMAWANSQETINPNYFWASVELWNLETSFINETGLNCWTKPTIVGNMIHAFRDSSHWSRRFEYPWAFWQMYPLDGKVILDAGSGRGVFQFFLSKYASEVHNIDIDGDALGIVKKIKILTGKYSNIITCTADLNNIPYPDEFFNDVCCLSVLEHISPNQRDKVINELIRVTKPNGKVLLSFDVSFGYEGIISLDELNALSKEFNFTIPSTERIMLASLGDNKLMGCACISLVKK